MDGMELFKKLAQCEDKEQMQRCIEEHRERQKPQTNADRIRAMSDEKLAELLVEEKEYGVCHIPYFRCPGGKEFNGNEYEDALQYTLDWLKQPAKE